MNVFMVDYIDGCGRVAWCGPWAAHKIHVVTGM